MINWDKLFSDYYIDFAIRNSRGWTHIQCPFCDDSGKHGGFHKNGNYSCFRCGPRKAAVAVSKIFKYSQHDSFYLIKKYHSDKHIAIEEEKKWRDQVEMPKGMWENCLTLPANNYLLQRNFDPYHLFKNYDIRSTGNWGDFSYRLIAPIYRQGKLISYIGRDYTDRSPLRYMACPMKEEARHYKWSCYGIDKITQAKEIRTSCLIVEGITDQWRMGDGSVALYGTGFTRLQVLEIARSVNRAFILFDPDDAGQLAAEKLQRELELFGVDCQNLMEDSGKDPGDYTDVEAMEIMRELGLK